MRELGPATVRASSRPCLREVRERAILGHLALLCSKIIDLIGVSAFGAKEQHTSALAGRMFIFDCSIAAFFPFPILAISTLSTPNVFLIRIAIEKCGRPVIATLWTLCTVLYARHLFTSVVNGQFAAAI